jgi:hypothetical protein
MENNPVVEPVVEPIVEPIVEPVVEPVIEPKPQTKNELLRELSKEHGVDLFSAEGIAKFKTYQDSQKTAVEKLDERVKTFESKEAEWETEKLEYEGKLKASELGIAPDKLEDALKLADGNPDNLAEVLKKYPVFKSTEGIQIGVQEPNSFQNPTGGTEVEQYMADNPQLYGKK